MKILEQYKSARRVGTPLMAIATPDPASTMATIVDNTSEDIPILSWNICEGWQPLNTGGFMAMRQVLGIRDINVERDAILEKTQDPMNCLNQAKKLPPKSVLFIMNGQMFLPHELDKGIVFTQGLWNLRDMFKQDKRTVVMVGSTFKLPPELKQDILLMDESLPSEEELRTIVTEVIESAKKGDWVKNGVTDAEIDKSVDALRGLSSFAAEQITSMSCSELNLDLDMLWERKRQIIEATPGLSVWREGQRFNDIGGIDSAKEFFNLYINGRSGPRCIVFIDEIEKAMAGVAGDLSGTSMDQLAAMLTTMQDNKWTGSIFYGQPGAAKTALAKAIGNEAGVPTIYFDLGSMKGSLIGESEHQIRDALKVIKAIGGDRVLFIATCNDIAPLKTELKRRFWLPTFFFDLPTKAERQVIWEIYLKKYGFDITAWGVHKSNADMDWTGAEIEKCCRLAWELNIQPKDTVQYVIPIAQSSAREVDERRKEADGNFLSASKPGKFMMDQSTPTGGDIPPTRPKRGPFG